MLEDSPGPLVPQPPAPPGPPIVGWPLLVQSQLLRKDDFWETLATLFLHVNYSGVSALHISPPEILYISVKQVFN